jgi:phosphatidylinositol alpha-mannosyltransferase
VVHITTSAAFLPVQFLQPEAPQRRTFHPGRERRQPLTLTGNALRRWFRNLDGKIAVSLPAMRMVSRYFPGYYNIIPNGVDVRHFSAPVAPLPQYCDGKLNILFVGRMEKRKGVANLLRAYVRVKEDARYALDQLSGRRPASAGLQRTVRDAGLRDVVFAGYAIKSCATIARPRLLRPATGHESQGIVLLEAMAAGKPIVASNIEGYAGVLTQCRGSAGSSQRRGGLGRGAPRTPA